MADPQNLAKRVVDLMESRDSFSKWLGLKIASVVPGRVVLTATIRKDMLNGFGTCHGGITFAIADSTLGFAANTHGRLALTMEGNVSLTKAIHEGDVLTVTAEELSNGNRIAVYGVTMTNQAGVQVAVVRGTLYKLDVEHFPGETKP